MTKAKILIVEDDRIVAKDIENTLKNLGFSVSSIVSSGEEAINKVKKKSPDLVLMDIVLKGEMDGIEAAKQIKERFHIPVVYLTAYADKKLLERVKITEPFGYIVKPFEERELHTTIEIALYKHKAGEERKELITELKEALSKVKTLSGLLPICANCKKIRDDKGYWNQIEVYIRDHSEADFSHSICPECAKKLYPEFYKGD